MSSWRDQWAELGTEGAEKLWQENWEQIQGYRELSILETWSPAEVIADHLLETLDKPMGWSPDRAE